jgi:hypothetical protein
MYIYIYIYKHKYYSYKDISGNDDIADRMLTIMIGMQIMPTYAINNVFIHIYIHSHVCIIRSIRI